MYFCFIDYYKTFDCVDHNKLGKVLREIGIPDHHIKKQRHTLPTKICLVKTMVFPVVMYGCDSWSIKKAKCLRIDAFELWCWRRLLRVPWIARSPNQSIHPKGSQSWIFIGRTDAGAEAPILWPPDVKSCCCCC